MGDRLFLTETDRLELKQAAVDLRGGANVIRRFGWGRGVFINPTTGRVCVLGALRVHLAGNAQAAAAESFVGTSDVCRRYDAAHVELSDHLGQSAARWNDTECDSGPRAIAALEAAADRAERLAGG